MGECGGFVECYGESCVRRRRGLWTRLLVVMIIIGMKVMRSWKTTWGLHECYVVHGISWAQGLGDWYYYEIHVSMALGD